MQLSRSLFLLWKGRRKGGSERNIKRKNAGGGMGGRGGGREDLPV